MTEYAYCTCQHKRWEHRQADDTCRVCQCKQFQDSGRDPLDGHISTEVHDRYCTTCESTHDGTETPRGLAWTCDGCGERQEYRA